MLNVIIFLVGALIMFYMALRSVRARQQLRTKGVCVQATVSGTVQSRDGAAYVLEFTTAGGSHRLQYPKPAKGKPFAEGSVVTLYYDPDAPEKMFVEGDKSVLGAGLFVQLGRRGAGRHHHVFILAAAHQALFLEGSQPLPQAGKGTAVGEPLRYLVPVHAVAAALHPHLLHALCLRDVGL